MTTQATAKKTHLRPLALGTAIAMGAALAASVSAAIGAAVGAALIVPALREKEKLTIREGMQLAVIALFVGLVVAGGVSVIENWSDFKEGFVQGYQRR